MVSPDLSERLRLRRHKGRSALLLPGHDDPDRDRRGRGGRTRHRSKAGDGLRRAAADQMDRPAQLYRRYANTNRKVLPICFKAGALADGVPARDLWVSPKHAMFIEHVLVPAEYLLNGASIVQPETADRVDYFHIELESHDVIFANGALSETFVDLGDRDIFQNAAEFAKTLSGA